MSSQPIYSGTLPAEQLRIQAKCFHPSGTFVEFKKEEVEQSVPERFEQIVRRYPDRLAVKTKAQSLTYDELNKAANRMARAILTQRGEREEPIALLLDTDASMMTAMISVLKAGRFYVSLDPSQPRTRSFYILEDTRAGLIVTNAKHLAFAEELAQHELRVLDVDATDAGLSDANPGLAIPPDTPTWIICTSGSTGQPKGVVQNHRNLLHATMKRTNAFRICAEDRLTLLNRAVMTIYSSLLNGACLYPFDVKEYGVTELAAWMIREGITLYHSSASLFRQFVGTLTGKEEFSKLRLVRLASESVTKADVDLYRNHFSSNCIFANGLASTETGTSLLYFIDKSTAIPTNTVPIGYPLKDIEILLLDDSLSSF
jgi:non-ribosomal peptide synthetase component F